MKFLFPIIFSGFLLMVACTKTNNQSSTEETNIEQVILKDLNRDSIEIEGITRYFEYLAPNELSEGASLVFVLHGSNGTIDDARRQTGYEFEKIGLERENYVIVYPAGYDKHWNDCRMNASYKANQEDVNDIEFFSEMIEHFKQNFQINEEAVFVTGISNGGHMCYKLGYELPEKFKAIAPFVANIPEKITNDCTPKNQAMNVLIVNGTKDRINPNEGGWVVLGQDSTRGVVMSTANSVAYWKNLANCEELAQQVTAYDDVVKADSSKVIHYKYECPETKKKVELVEVVNGGHVVPVNDTIDIPAEIKKFIGNKNRDVNAPMIVLDFFESLL